MAKFGEKLSVFLFVEGIFIKPLVCVSELVSGSFCMFLIA